MHRLEIIQSLINKTNAKKYLEIGIYQGHVFDNVICDYKVGVDPDKNSSATLFMTSDEFFKTNNEKFDVIFIDGLHYSDQVYKDINNSLEILNDGGYIVCHDMLPPDENCQIVPPIQTTWTGDCWKAWVKLRSQRDDLNMSVVDTDYGCGVITRGSQQPITIDRDLTWSNFVTNKNNWLNIISVQQFLEL